MAKLTEQAKLANKYNKRIRDYNKIFGKGYAHNIYTDIEGIVFTAPKQVLDEFDKPIFRFTGGHHISAETFTRDDAADIIAELERRLPSPGKKLERMKAETGITDTSKLVGEIIAKDDVSDRFYKAKWRFYQLEKAKDYAFIYAEDPQVRRAHELIYHEGKWESYTAMLEAIQEAEEVLQHYGY